ncbi:hypothetical protein [Burkholderia gladioli]|uniref:hypothetical protein n=1 Tax=Burkholderia gladioli TaxID=28095 RepID=UPI00163F540F|nr:hypothetical protein [Burkholderia gladioli]
MSDKLSDDERAHLDAEVRRDYEMSAKWPFDASDAWWNDDSRYVAPPAVDSAHAAARAIICDLSDRGGIKRGFENIDEETRVEIVTKLAAIIRAASPAPAIPVLDEKAFASWVRTQDGGVGIYDAYLHGTKAAPAISESDVLRHRALAAEARCDYVIKILTRIHGFLLPNDVRLPDGRVFEFNNPKVEHEMLRGLRDAIRTLPDEIAAIDAARKGEKS